MNGLKILDDEFEVDDEEVLEDDLDDDLVEDLDPDLDEDLDEEIDEELVADVGDVIEGDDEDEDDVESVPVARRKVGDDDDDDDEDLDPDDVEADLNEILKGRIAAGSDEDDEEEADTTGQEATDRVQAKTAEEFTCATCFMIVHPRQFGRKGQLTCPEGYDPCSSIAIVEKRLKG